MPVDESGKTPLRLAKFLVDAYLIDGSFYCYDCAEQIGFSFVDRHIRVRKLNCPSCMPTIPMQQYLDQLSKDQKELERVKTNLFNMQADRDGYRSKYASAHGKLVQLREILHE